MNKARLLGIVAAIGLGNLACSSKSTPLASHDGAADQAAGTGGGMGGGGGGASTGGSTATGAFTTLGSGGGGGTAAPGTGGMVGTGGLTGRGGIVAGGGTTTSGTGGAGAGGSTGKGGSTSKGGASGLGGTNAGGSGGGSPLDAALDGSQDTGTNPDRPPPECLSLPGGTCTTMVNGCASCPAGFRANPTRAGCDERYEWCCTKVAPEPSDCTDGGGVCIANGGECPDKWTKTRTMCATDSNPICCERRAADCPAFPQGCVDIGGVCTPERWAPCPVGMEINALGADQLGCENDLQGWCCVDAPPSTCSDSGGLGVCVPGECSGCFAPVSDPNLTCEAGRSCCVDICD